LVTSQKWGKPPQKKKKTPPKTPLQPQYYNMKKKSAEFFGGLILSLTTLLLLYIKKKSKGFHMNLFYNSKTKYFIKKTHTHKNKFAHIFLVMWGHFDKLLMR
jgi:hypothetical protein